MIRAGRLYLLLIVVLLSGATALRLADPFFVQALRFIAFDSYQRLAPETFDPNLPVRIVHIDQDSLDRFGQWPWPRTAPADLLPRPTAHGPAARALDFPF